LGAVKNDDVGIAQHFWSFMGGTGVNEFAVNSIKNIANIYLVKQVSTHFESQLVYADLHISRPLKVLETSPWKWFSLPFKISRQWLLRVSEMWLALVKIL